MRNSAQSEDVEDTDVFYWFFLCEWLQVCDLKFYSAPVESEKSSEATSVFSPSSTPEREGIVGPSQRVHLRSPPSPTSEGLREKRGRGGAAGGKCVLKMAELPLAAQLRSHVCGRADVLGEDGRTDGRPCGNQRWLQSSTSSNPTAFHSGKVSKSHSLVHASPSNSLLGK